MFSGCELYDLDGGDIILDIPDVTFEAQPEIHYEISGSFDAEVRFEYLSNQGVLIPDPSLTRRLAYPSGVIKFSEPLRNTRYRILAYAVTRRSGVEVLLDDIVKEYGMDVVTQPLNITLPPQLDSVSRVGNVPLFAELTVQGTGIRPSALMVLMDTTYGTDPHNGNLLDSVNTPGLLFFGYGIKTADLGAGVEEWTYFIDFKCHGSILSGGVQSYTAGQTVFVTFYNINSSSDRDYNHIQPSPSSPIGSWWTVGPLL